MANVPNPTYLRRCSNSKIVRRLTLQRESVPTLKTGASGVALFAWHCKSAVMASTRQQAHDLKRSILRRFPCFSVQVMGALTCYGFHGYSLTRP